MNAKTFGTFIAKCRKEIDMTQADLAMKINVTDKAVSRWERGVGFPDISTIEPLASALRLSVLEIMKSEKDKTGECSTFRVFDGYFRPHTVHVTADVMASLPAELWEHVHSGGKLWKIKPAENGKTLLSSAKKDGIQALVDASGVIVKLNTKDEFIEQEPEPIRSHLKNGGNLYIIGEPKDGKILVSTSEKPGGYTITEDYVTAAEDLGNDYAEFGEILHKCICDIKSKELSDKVKRWTGKTMFDYLRHCTLQPDLDNLTAIYRDTADDDIIIGYAPIEAAIFVGELRKRYPAAKSE